MSIKGNKTIWLYLLPCLNPLLVVTGAAIVYCVGRSSLSYQNKGLIASAILLFTVVSAIVFVRLYYPAVQKSLLRDRDFRSYERISGDDDMLHLASRSPSPCDTSEVPLLSVPPPPLAPPPPPPPPLRQNVKFNLVPRTEIRVREQSCVNGMNLSVDELLKRRRNLKKVSEDERCRSSGSNSSVDVVFNTYMLDRRRKMGYNEEDKNSQSEDSWVDDVDGIVNGSSINK